MFTELPPTITACVCLCLCAFGTMDQMTYFLLFFVLCFFFQICIRVLFYSLDILRACFFFFFFCESSVGRGDLVDLSDFFFFF